MKQQDREEQKVNEGLDLSPYGAVEGGKAADQVAAQDQGEIGKQQLRKIHAPRIAAALDAGMPPVAQEPCFTDVESPSR